MKKMILVAIMIIAVLAVISCSPYHSCPAYGKAEPVQSSKSV